MNRIVLLTFFVCIIEIYSFEYKDYDYYESDEYKGEVEEKSRYESVQSRSSHDKLYNDDSYDDAVQAGQEHSDKQHSESETHISHETKSVQGDYYDDVKVSSRTHETVKIESRFQNEVDQPQPSDVKPEHKPEDTQPSSHDLKPSDKPTYDVKDAQKLFEKFMKDFNKHYKDAADQKKHYDNFVKTLEEINKTNSGTGSFSTDINQFADWGEEEQNTNLEEFGDDY